MHLFAYIHRLTIFRDRIVPANRNNNNAFDIFPHSTVNRATTEGRSVDFILCRVSHCILFRKTVENFPTLNQKTTFNNRVVYHSTHVTRPHLVQYPGYGFHKQGSVFAKTKHPTSKCGCF